MHRMFNSVAKLHLISAACCFTLMLIHAYWIHGSRAVWLAESANPTLVTHASSVNVRNLDLRRYRVLRAKKGISTSLGKPY
eukprot:5527207-Pleurochrysis_carterae.AAC.1